MTEIETGAEDQSTNVVRGSVPPLVSQLVFSAVSFFSIAGLSRRSPSTEAMAAVTAAYALESIAVASANARWTSLFVLKEASAPARGDVAYMAKRFLGISLAGLPVFLIGALIVQWNVVNGLAAAAWCSAMLFCDISRFAAARFLGLRPVALVAMIHLLVGTAITFIGPPDLAEYLVLLASVSTVVALLNLWVLSRGRREGLSPAWARFRLFARSLVVEAASVTVAIGVGSALISALSPDLAVGLQLGNQVLVMPAIVVAQAIGLPLSRRLRDSLEAGVYPNGLLLKWTAAVLAIPVCAVAVFFILKPVVYRLLGGRASLAYEFLPVAFLQMLIILLWQPFTMARRWTNGPESISRHVAYTMGAYYAAVVVVTASLRNSPLMYWAVITVSTLAAISTVGRAIYWWWLGRTWHRPKYAEPWE